MTYIPAVRQGHKPQLLKFYSFPTDHSTYMLVDTINMMSVEKRHLNINFHPKAENSVIPTKHQFTQFLDLPYQETCFP